MEILFAGAVFHREWRGGEPVIGKELIRHLSKKNNCYVCNSMPLLIDKTRSISRFIENDNSLISNAINRSNISEADVVLAFYDFDLSIMRQCIKKQIPVLVTQHIYWGLCPKFDFWNNVHNCSCSKVESEARDCKNCISKQANLGPQVVSSLFPKKVVNNLRINRKRVLQKCNAIIVPSNFMVEIYKKELEDMDVRAVHNGIDTAFYRPTENRTRGQKKRILYAGARTNVKGYHHFVKLATEVSKLRDNVEFLAFGYGQGSFHNCVKDLGYINKSDLPKAYSNGYLLVFPALWDEPFAQIPLESMACGCPVIAYGSGGISEMISNGQNGNLVSTGDFDQLLKTTIELIDNPAKTEKMRLTSRRFIEKNFSLEAMLRNYEKIVVEFGK